MTRVQQAYFAQRRTRLSSLLGVIVGQDFTTVVQAANPEQWVDTLALLLTYAQPQDLPGLCDLLAQRLANVPGREQLRSVSSCLCRAQMSPWLACLCVSGRAGLVFLVSI